MCFRFPEVHSVFFFFFFLTRVSVESSVSENMWVIVQLSWLVRALTGYWESEA